MDSNITIHYKNSYALSTVHYFTLFGFSHFANREIQAVQHKTKLLMMEKGESNEGNKPDSLLDSKSCNVSVIWIYVLKTCGVYFGERFRT